MTTHFDKIWNYFADNWNIWDVIGWSAFIWLWSDPWTHGEYVFLGIIWLITQIPLVPLG